MAPRWKRTVRNKSVRCLDSNERSRWQMEFMLLLPMNRFREIFTRYWQESEFWSFIYCGPQGEILAQASHDKEKFNRRSWLRYSKKYSSKLAVFRDRRIDLLEILLKEPLTNCSYYKTLFLRTKSLSL
jgi:hypothetical protein